MFKYLALIALGSLIAIPAVAQDKALDLATPAPHASPNPPKNTYCDELVNVPMSKLDTAESERCAAVLLFERDDAESYKNAAMLLYVANNARRKEYEKLWNWGQQALEVIANDGKLLDSIFAQRTAPQPSAVRSFFSNFATNFAQIQAQQREVTCTSSAWAYQGGQHVTVDTTCH